MGSMTGAHERVHPTMNRKQSVFCMFLMISQLCVSISFYIETILLWVLVACEGSLINLHAGTHRFTHTRLYTCIKKTL